MFKPPAKLLLVAMDEKNEPMWGASMVPARIEQRMMYGEVPEIEIAGQFIDGPVPIEKILADLDGKF